MTSFGRTLKLPGEKDEQVVALVRALADVLGVDAVVSDPADLARSALANTMGALYKIVQDDDGLCWPFVPGADYWRGPLRKKDGRIQEARFYPETEKIVWCAPWLDADEPASPEPDEKP